MTIAVADFADKLPGEKLTWDIVRFDEYDSIGSGHDIVAEMAPPKWTAKLGMRPLVNAEAEALAARVRSLNGSQETFYMYNPSRKYPLSDPNGSILGASVVQINTIGSDNRSVSLKGLPAGYVLSLADKAQIVFASGTRNFFFEFSADVTANGSGVTAEVLIWPHIPVGVIANATLVLKKPACKMQLKPDGFSPGVSSGPITDGASIEVLERI